MSFAYDVFLSHSSKDKILVRGIAEGLKKHGLRVWFDEWEIRPGDSIPSKIEEGLELSRVLVLCMSTDSFGSDWVILESQTFRFRDPMNRQRRFVPIKLDSVKVPGSLGQFKWIDWNSSGVAKSFDLLVDACRHETSLPKLHGGHVIKAAPIDPVQQNPEPGSPEYRTWRRNSVQQVFSSFESVHEFFFKLCVDYSGVIEVLRYGFPASREVRDRYSNLITEIGSQLNELHRLEGRLHIAGAIKALNLMKTYRLSATDVNDMLLLQCPGTPKKKVEAVTENLFQNKDRLYSELAAFLKAT